MGNCVFQGVGEVEVEEVIKVVTSNGGIMELYAPLTAEFITSEFPGHGIFRSQYLFSEQPLLHNEELLVGELYYLLPLNTSIHRRAIFTAGIRSTCVSSSSSSSSSLVTPYRMSFDSQGILKRSESEVLSRQQYNNNNNNNNNYNTGVWKVKLVISPEQLAEILSQETRTEALIESVRTVAKCGNGAIASAANSDQWSISSSWKASSSDRHGLFDF
ncbi:uncharacterized protein LOC122663888 [Telopea speciosissima]|uniref:uncharacterized protein LOC122663888 n=1 Tax=Telopea speciosissima TaxID=54955 RepID=UPI001CC7156E|nr:uncharacterized protein LOC122663888 [Telopea speciosissima]